MNQEVNPVEIRAPQGARLLEIDWSDGTASIYEHLVLRAFCPCAYCQGHQGPIEWVNGVDNLDSSSIELVDIKEMGSYAISLTWKDGHSTGIYTFRYLQTLTKVFGMDDASRRKLSFER